LQDVFVADNWKEVLASITDMENSITGDLEILAGHTIQGIDRKVAELWHLMEESLRLGRETRDEVKVSPPSQYLLQMLTRFQASKQLHILDSLPCAVGAKFGSFEDQNKPLCLEGTQTHILSQIQSWCEDPWGKPIFWLEGMPSTGKTTISRTFALACRDGTPLVVPDHRLPNTVVLGASFFFSIGQSLIGMKQARSSLQSVEPLLVCYRTLEMISVRRLRGTPISGMRL
jgi:hypothetical protein